MTTSAVTALHDLTPPAERVNVPTNDVDFYRLPFPNDLHIGADGTADLSLYPREDGLVGQYVQAIDDGLRGAGTNSGIFFRFDGAIDPATLPADPAASITEASTVFVVDVTPGSPTYGERHPIKTTFVAPSYDFIGPNWVAIMPFPGIALREKTTYAAVLTDGLKAATGGKVVRYKDFDAALQKNPTDPRVIKAAAAYKPFLDWLETQPTLKTKVVNATVFTTLDATSIMFKLREAVYAKAPAPTLTDLAFLRQDSADNDLFTASYMTPNFQQGDSPYLTRGGSIDFETDGTPKLVRMEPMRLVLSIPKGPMPAAGWPVVIYAHGTGGSYMSCVNDESAKTASKVLDGNGNELARMAMLCVDQVLAGPRDPTNAGQEITFFNFQNVVGARDNPKQGALDNYQIVRLIHTVDVASAPMTGGRIKFDVNKIYFKGHSQGSLTGSLAVAAEPEIKAAIFSGPGAVLIYSILNKKEPVDIPALVSGILRDPINEWHPLLSLLQAYLEESDPANYGRLYFQEPPAGVAPKSIFQTIGFVDKYAPVPNGKAQALAGGLQPVKPMQPSKPGEIDDGEIAGLEFIGQTWAAPPVANNVGGGMATGVVLEYKAPGNRDGHFVIFDVPAATDQSNRFFATHVATGTARLTPP